MTNEEREKHIRVASVLIGAINDLIRPILMYQIEKDVTREALENYINMLEQQPCEDCISREQTLKAFAEKCGGECACCEYNGSGYDTAENCKLIKSMPSVTSQQTRWISVSERLPEPQNGEDKNFSEWVLITSYIGKNDYVVGRAYYCFSDKKWYAERFGCGKVIAWMPLPDPYKAESEESE